VDQWENTDSWEELFEEFYLLGKLLGFTWEQVEEAYYLRIRSIMSVKTLVIN